MKVANRRWGEVTIKKQGERKNRFDSTKSFSIVRARYDYNITELEGILERVVDLTQVYDFMALTAKIDELERNGKGGGDTE
jgi:hypothetical protein